MSQYKFINKDGREVIYGLDKPTGGYFWSEFYTDEELENLKPEEDELFDSSTALTLSELVNYLVLVNAPGVSFEKLFGDFFTASEPTQLQYNTAKMFGQNLNKDLDRVARDIDEYRK
jgi:hypothetical protein